MLSPEDVRPSPTCTFTRKGIRSYSLICYIISRKARAVQTSLLARDDNSRGVKECFGPKAQV